VSVVSATEVDLPPPDLEGILADVRELIECESPSSDLAAVARSADLVARIGTTRLGVAPERIVVDGCTHLRWRLGARVKEERVLLLAHHDTVHPIGTLATSPYSLEDGVLRGPGCFDMLAGLVMALHAVAALPDRDGVTLLVTGDEEIGSPTSRALIEDDARGARAALVLEASADGGALKTARKGAALYELEVTGRAAHAGLEPDSGLNASVELAHQILAVSALGSAELGTSVTPTTAASGTATNVVPARASLAVDVRAWTVAEQDRVDAALRALTPVTPGISLVLHGEPNRPPMEERASAELLTRAVRVAGSFGLPPLEGVGVGGASDGNFTAGIGTPTLDGLGAVGGGAHAAHEFVLVDRLVDRTRLVAGLTHDLLQEDLR
jgi:glutamate carboxypeptidase